MLCLSELVKRLTPLSSITLKMIPNISAIAVLNSEEIFSFPFLPNTTHIEINCLRGRRPERWAGFGPEPKQVKGKKNNPPPLVKVILNWMLLIITLNHWAVDIFHVLDTLLVSLTARASRYMVLWSVVTAETGKFLLSAKRNRRTTSTEYTISMDADNISRSSRTYIGKVK